jgi:hypothetical protein
MSITVKRVKAADGREGSYAPIGNGLIKLMFDDGSMTILKEFISEPTTTDESLNNSGETQRHA